MAVVSPSMDKVTGNKITRCLAGVWAIARAAGRLIVVMTGILCAPASARADWINLSGAENARNIAEITVLEDRVRIALEIFVGDLEQFQDLIPEAWTAETRPDRPGLAERMKHFSTSVIQVRAGPDDIPLIAQLRIAEPRLRKDRISLYAGMVNPMSGRKVPGPPQDKRALYAELDYLFSGQPDSVTIIPPVDEEGVVNVTIGFVAYHKAVPVIDFRYLSKPAVLRLDWEDPWYSRFDNPNLKRHHKSALMSFLYVEPRDVRHEILIRVRDLEDWTDLGLDESGSIPPEAQARLKNRAIEFLRQRNPVTIDGETIDIRSTRAEFLEIALTGLQVIEDGRPLERNTAILGLIFSYPTQFLPQKVSVEWDLFSERNPRIPATSIDPAGPLPGFVEATDPVFEWTNYLRTYEDPVIDPVPVRWWPIVTSNSVAAGFGLAMVLAGFAAVRFWRRPVGYGAAALAIAFFGLAALAGSGRLEMRQLVVPAPDPATAGEIAQAVLSGVQAAYLERDSHARLRALEPVVAQRNSGQIVPELDRAFAIAMAGGSVGGVDTIKDLSMDQIAPLEQGAGFGSLAEWTAAAKAGHWGHQHARDIRFRALLEFVEDGSNWKLSGITVVDAS